MTVLLTWGLQQVYQLLSFFHLHLIFLVVAGATPSYATAKKKLSANALQTKFALVSCLSAHFFAEQYC